MGDSVAINFGGLDAVAPSLVLVIFLVGALIGLAFAILGAVMYCKICSKTGYHWALGLLMFVPIANFIILLVLAFGEWPIQKELQACKHQINNNY
jgi:hypothetical protein